jgi:hypothetical protein
MKERINGDSPPKKIDCKTKNLRHTSKEDADVHEKLLTTTNC